MADFEPRVFLSPSLAEPDTNSGATLPWLGPDYNNGNISFETQFQDWQIENPAVVLQEVLGELWKKVVDGIQAEFGGLPMLSLHTVATAAAHTDTRSPASSKSSSGVTVTVTRTEDVCRCNS
ncbi:hypothetical protein A1O1_08151 [Capronia coronata CBS 617.96]|uniref:Uncharacterized protein n=1 Tax=Capronia coronata CBS 617.96 TaxID=1182541 RepID=W9XNF3_9EURO|nr:uncharacterized protein A1O1_08151 [Capronia coronata CBS 617.96]EXJ82082.1 hypothetical protein A1O1_08151 [Capronia coronata CBS 617.96]